jgi:pimeloyl-ACP methyl ester carboxylesterase
MSNFRHRQVLLNGLSLHVAEAGDPQAQPIVLLHGWPQSWAQWRPVMERAAGDFRAVAIDLPGVGESAGAAPDGSKRTLAAIVHGLIEQLGLGGATIVGHDVGGMIAYAYLRDYQDIGGAVIVDVVIPGLDPWDEVIASPYLWHFAFHSVPALPERLVQGHQGPYFDTSSTRSPPIRPGSPPARAAYAQAYASGAALTAGFDFYRGFAQDARDNLGAAGPTDTPVLYLRGEASRGDLGSYARGLEAAGVRRLTAGIVPGAGHFVADEQPAELWRQIREFIFTSSRA